MRAYLDRDSNIANVTCYDPVDAGGQQDSGHHTDAALLS